MCLRKAFTNIKITKEKSIRIHKDYINKSHNLGL